MRASHRLSQGLIYFPLKTNILSNDKIKILRADNGHEGFACLMYLYIELYGHNYYKKFGLREKKLFCDEQKISKVKLDEVLETCFSEDLFDATLYSKYEILTSEEIQFIWSDVTYRREEIVMIKEYMLIDVGRQSLNNRITIVDLNKNYIQESARKLENAEKKGIKPIPKDESPKPPVAKPVKKEELMPLPKIGEGFYLPEEARQFCEKIYDDENEKFKSQIDQVSFNSFIKFNLMIDKDFQPLRISNKQLSCADFIKLNTLPVNGIVPDKNEIKLAVKKLTGTGVNPNASIYHKLIENIEYLREPKNGKNGSAHMPVRKVNIVDHSADAKNF